MKQRISNIPTTIKIFVMLFLFYLVTNIIRKH